ncbi:MAG: hydrogenase 3 maturation endopeptidase HyCI [Candidatus Hodarchaeales archaeon]
MNAFNELTEFMASSKKGKLAILCVGNDLRGDDGLGPYIAKKLRELRQNGLIVYDTGNQPENYLSVLAREQITHCLIIDAVEFHQEPGSIGFFDPSDLKEYQVTFSTHFLGMKTLIDVFGKSTGAIFKILGIQPKTLEFGSEMCDEVQIAALKLFALLHKLLE